MDPLEDDSVHLVVTSPPYPMVEMWDDAFATLNHEAHAALEDEDGPAAFEAMHRTLDEVWDEAARVLKPGGIACINIGDAVRRIGDRFQAYPNHARIIDTFTHLGFDSLPDILWRKPTNSPSKFVGSGMLPTNAYATLEHEHILIFRNGENRSFPPNHDPRYESAYFWEERNRWFSDVWTDVNGALQDLEDDASRERSAAYPFEIPYRLINMYSVHQDTVLDPFWGTGTTTLAAIAAARNSIAFELQDAFAGRFHDRIQRIPPMTQRVATQRLHRHLSFVEQRQRDGHAMGYEHDAHGFPVTTKQERRLRLYTANEIDPTDDGYETTHAPLDPDAEPTPTGKQATLPTGSP